MGHYITNLDPEHYKGDLEAAVKKANEVTGEKIELFKYPMPAEGDWGGSDRYDPARVPELWCLWTPVWGHDLSSWWDAWDNASLRKTF